MLPLGAFKLGAAQDELHVLCQWVYVSFRADNAELEPHLVLTLLHPSVTQKERGREYETERERVRDKQVYVVLVMIYISRMRHEVCHLRATASHLVIVARRAEIEVKADDCSSNSVLSAR